MKMTHFQLKTFETSERSTVFAAASLTEFGHCIIKIELRDVTF